jgi:hypothetical protein
MKALYQAVYPTTVAADAASVPITTLRLRIKNGDVMMADSESSAALRSTRSIYASAVRIMQIRLAELLVKSGIPSKEAYELALAFTDHGAADSALKANILGEGSVEPRIPGDVYSTGTTVLRVLFPAQGEPVASVDRLENIKDELVRDHMRFERVLIVNLNEIRAQTLQALNLGDAA